MPASDPPPPAPAGGSGEPARQAGPAWPASARSRPGPLPAQQRLARQIAASHQARRQRALLAVLGALSALVLCVSGGAWVLASYVTGHVGRVSAGTSGTPSSGPLNILVAGVDVRSGLTRHQQLALHVGATVSSNSDTLMLVHIPADDSYVQVVSLPRDSWVRIPGHGMSKINAAFGLGGPRLMVRTVEAATGLTINDYAEINFLGFVRVIDAVGGVNICLPFAVNDSYSGLHLSAGAHHVNGVTALEFARDRHSFAASDLTRINDQQQLMATLLSQVASAGTLSNPFKLQSLLSSVTSAIKVDRGFNIVSLASQLRGIRPSNVAFSTVPLGNLNYQTPSGQLAVTWNASVAGRLFSQIKNDQRPTALLAARHRPAAHHRPGRRHHRRHHRRPGVADGAPAGPGQAATPVPGTGQQITASQNACR